MDSALQLFVRKARAARRQAGARVAGYAHALRRPPADPELLRQALHDSCDVATLLDGLRTQRAPFFFGRGEASAIAAELETSVPGWRERTLRDADRIATGVVRLLGHDRVDLRARGTAVDGAHRIPWHEDPGSGFRWDPRAYYRLIDVPYDSGADIKLPWELSRCQHLPTLGMAYAASGDERYAGALTAQIDDWIGANPPGYGVNWVCTMDVAIRVVNWLWACRLVADAAASTDAFLTRLAASLVAHGRHIARNIERYEGGVTTNHTLADYTGLLYLGIALPDLRESDGWVTSAMAGVADCMRTQVLPDGAAFESSIPYHRLVLEMFLGCHVLAERNGRPFDADYRASLERMLEFVLHYSRPDGLAPVIGDSDDGRLQILSDYFDWRPQDHRYLLGAGAALLGRADFAAAAEGASGAAEEAAWLLGPGSRTPPPAARARGSRRFGPSGRYVMRDGESYAIVCADPVGTAGLGNHKHNDILAFELVLDGAPIVVDPGSYLYTSDLSARDSFRATSAHSTVRVDGAEQNRFAGAFGMSPDARVEVERWETGAALDLLGARHSGYERLPAPVSHRRVAALIKQPLAWIVLDSLEGAGEHRVESFVHLAPGGSAAASPPGEGALEAARTALATLDVDAAALQPELAIRYANVAIVPLGCEGSEVESGWVAARYGQRVAAPVVRLAGPSAPGLTFGYVVVPTTSP